MIGSRLNLTTVAVLCAFACVLVVNVHPVTAATRFGEEGTQIGQFKSPNGIAVDQTSGDVYIADKSNLRIDKFDELGNPLFAWGWQVNQEAPAEELQRCQILCQKGVSGTGLGQYGSEGPRGLAVDNQPFSLSRGDVYVVNWENYRVEKYDAEGNFILMFGGEVNEDTSDVCTVSEKCKIGVEGTANGEFQWAYDGSYIAVGPGGKVYVGDKARVQVFNEQGQWQENISVAGISSEGQVSALAVDKSGDIFVKDNEASGVQEFEPDGTQKPVVLDAESYPIGALAVDDSDNLYVGDISDGFHILKFDPSGEELASFGLNLFKGPNEEVKGMAFADTSNQLYATGGISGEGVSESSVAYRLTPPPPGPLIEPDSESTIPGLGGEAKLKAVVNPEGHATTYHFEYVDTNEFQASGYTNATSTATVSIAESSFESIAVEAQLTDLSTAGVTYHWRLVASNECEAGITCTVQGPDQVFEETPAARTDGPWTANVSSTSVTLAARIDPLGVSTAYQLEYGTTTSYGTALSGSVGEGDEFVPISHHLQGLEPDTTYHYRVVTSNSFGIVEGEDHTFATQLVGSIELGLPDGRAWELVSPARTGGSVLRVTQAGTAAAGDGGAITYKAKGTPLGEGAVSKNSIFLGSQVLSTRSSNGWRSEAINPPQEPLVNGEAPSSLPGGGATFALFSEDLTSDVLYPAISSSYSPAALSGSPYMRGNLDRSYMPLLTSANVWPGTTSLETSPPPAYLRNKQVAVIAGTPDLSHIILGSPLKLTEEASVLGEDIFFSTGNLYEWDASGLQLVNRLPETNEATTETSGALLAGVNGKAQGAAARAVSDDGRWVAWTRGDPYKSDSRMLYKGLYLRDMVAGKTVQLGGPSAIYQTMNSDGSRLFFVEKGDLYEYDSTAGARIDITASHGAGETEAGVLDAVSNVSEDGSYVYYVAKGVLANGGVSGGNNLYLSHYFDGKWSTSYITTLSSEDEKDWTSPQEEGFMHLENLTVVTSRVSRNGRYLAFMSQGSLTGYDNTDANPEAYEMKQHEEKLEVVTDGEGKPVRAHDVEVYLYDATNDRLVCASCDPTGARPTGVFTGKRNAAGELELLNVETGAWSEPGKEHWLAASVPGWQLNVSADTVHQPRYLSDDGRMFFNSSTALVSRDTNGLEDVYQYEPTAIGDCSTASATFGADSGGCVGLISSGTSSEESAFMDASENGDDVFFLTSYQLTAADDEATGYHVWDAHVCSASVPCASLPVQPPPCSTGDSCKAAPTPQPEIFGPAPSATFSGAGNAVPAKPRALTRAQRLAHALKACKKKRRKHRTSCERKARRQFNARQSRKVGAAKRGGRS